jgi:hypothetical protein
MGLSLAVTAGLVIWLVLWTLDVKAIDGIMITAVIALIAVMLRMLSQYMPGNRRV